MSEKQTVQAELPVLRGESLGIKTPFSFIQKSLLSTFHGKLPTDVQVGISSGHPVSERIKFFLY